MFTIIRRQRNCIEGIKMEDESWHNSREDIGSYLCFTFQNLYSTSSPTVSGDISALFSPVVSTINNDLLCRIPDETEIWQAVRSIGATKVPGSD